MAGTLRFADFHLAAELLKREHSETDLGMYHFTPMWRFLLEDIVQTVIQVMFLAKHAQANPMVVTSVAVGITVSALAGLKSVKEVCGCSAAPKEGGGSSGGRNVQMGARLEATVTV